MRMTRWLLTLVCLATVPSQSEPLTIMRAGAKNKAGVAVHFEARFEPSGERSQLRGFGGGVRTGPEAIHRWMVQASRKEYFGYDVQIEPIDGKREFRVSVLPLSMKNSDLGRQDAEAWTELSLPNYPAPQITVFHR